MFRSYGFRGIDGEWNDGLNLKLDEETKVL
jgi:hypothetical protein